MIGLSTEEALRFFVAIAVIIAIVKMIEWLINNDRGGNV